jgi:hypothetical protein
VFLREKLQKSEEEKIFFKKRRKVVVGVDEREGDVCM